MTLWEKIKEANKILKAGEPQNIQIEEHSGKVFTGYLPQAVVDAVNEAIGPESWFYEVEIVSQTASEKAYHAAVKVRVQMEIGSVVREAFGGGTSPGSPGDALKAATTDALKKALAAFSIGNRAYLGLLEKSSPSEEENSRDTTTATTKQMNLIKALYRRLHADGDLRRKHENLIRKLNDKYPGLKDGILTQSEASEIITALKDAGIDPLWEERE